MIKYFNKNRQKLQKIMNIFKVDFSFIAMFVLSFLLDELKLCSVFCFFTLCHELAHFFVAKKLGYTPKKIHLTFFGASLEGVDDFLLQDEIKVVFAGPAFNLVVIVLCYLSFWFNPESYNYLQDVLVANWSIFLFNFLPIYPLDLGRMLLAIFTTKNERNVALEKTKKISMVFIFCVFILFVMSFFFTYNFSLGFACVNLTSLLFTSSKDTSYKRQIFVEKKFNKLSKGLLDRTIYVKYGTPLYSLFKHIDDFHYANFVFIDDDYKEVDKLSEIEFYKKTGLM